jgi:hypothetical protein
MPNKCAVSITVTIDDAARVLMDEFGEAVKELHSELGRKEAQIEALERLRQLVEPMVNDGEVHEMGGPFIDGKWVLRHLEAALAQEKTG